jgi:cytochrome P450
MISRRLAVLSFAAIQSSVITITNALFDILASPCAESTQAKLYEEVFNHLSNEKGAWTKASLAKMVHIDSTLRESMRLGGFVSRGVMKMVVAPSGVTLPDGTRLCHGTKIGVSAYNVHHDSDIYADASSFDAFRFSRLGSEVAAQQSERSSGATGFDIGKDKQTLVTTSPIFMAFSHGNHAWYVLTRNFFPFLRFLLSL